MDKHCKSCLSVRITQGTHIGLQQEAATASLGTEQPVFLLGRMRIKEPAVINSQGCGVGFKLQSANKLRSLILKVVSLPSAFA